MNAPTTLAAFGAGLVVVFAAAVAVGSAVGPVGGTPPGAHTDRAPMTSTR